MKRFPDNSRVCFVGDSITASITYTALIAAYYRENFKDSKIEFYNCGISGGSALSALSFFDGDITDYAPTEAVVMLGINDSQRENLAKQSDEGKAALDEAFAAYKERMPRLIKRLEDLGAHVTLCTPHPLR